LVDSIGCMRRIRHPDCYACAPQKFASLVARLARFREWFGSGCRSTVRNRGAWESEIEGKLASSSWDVPVTSEIREHSILEPPHMALG
jgi:hypothetical protein